SRSGVRRLRHLQVVRSREAGEGDRAGDHALQGSRRARACQRGPGRSHAGARGLENGRQRTDGVARLVEAGVKIGVLALQGDFALHVKVLRGCRDGDSGAPIEVAEVRKPEELDGLDGLIIPGGESTTLLKLMEEWRFVPALEKFHGASKPIFGTGAGLILLARDVESPRPFSLGFIDIDVARNGYGR